VCVIRCCEELEHPYDGSTPRIERERSKGEMGRRRKFKTIVLINRFIQTYLQKEFHNPEV
jgi:hypothetical protein